MKLTLTADQQLYVLNSPVYGSRGSVERMRVCDDIRAAKQDVIEVDISKDELFGWAEGIIAGWSQDTVSTQAGLIPLSDGHRGILRLAAKALHIWAHVSSKIERIKAKEDFIVDGESDVAVDP